MTFEIRELSKQELDEYYGPPVKARRVPAQCTCGRFARFVRFEANTMPHGESVTTVNCRRCGEVRIY